MMRRQLGLFGRPGGERGQHPSRVEQCERKNYQSLLCPGGGDFWPHCCWRASVGRGHSQNSAGAGHTSAEMRARSCLCKKLVIMPLLWSPLALWQRKRGLSCSAWSQAAKIVVFSVLWLKMIFFFINSGIWWRLVFWLFWEKLAFHCFDS